MTKRGKQRERGRQRAKQKRQSHAFSITESWSAIRTIVDICKRYSPLDVFVAVSVTELWPANIASVVRFRLLYSVAVALKAADFSDARIASYITYKSFLESILNALPSFPTLDDYIPEVDWGDTRVIVEEEEYRIFYGCTIERINDFIEVFKIIWGDNPLAIGDLKTVISFQSHILNDVEVTRDKFARAAPGYIEVPPPDFWEKATGAILKAQRLLEAKPLSGSLSLALGAGALPKSYREFGNSIFTGMIMPAPVVLTPQGPCPISIRNMTACVCDFWGDRVGPSETLDASRRLGTYLSERLDSKSFWPGNFSVVTRAGWRSPPIAGIIYARKDIYLLPIFDSSDLVRELKTFEATLRRISKEGTEWAVIREGESKPFIICNAEGSALSLEELTIIAVSNLLKSGYGMLNLNGVTSTVSPISELLMVLDSLDSPQELVRFLKFQKDLAARRAHWLANLCDQYAAFKASHEMLVAGASIPDIIMLDPHSGSNWRFEALKEFWSKVPIRLPTRSTAWTITEAGHGIRALLSKDVTVGSYAVTIGKTDYYFKFSTTGLEHDILLTSQIAHCLADAVLARHKLVSADVYPDRPTITTEILISKSASPDDAALKKPCEEGELDGVISVSAIHEDDHQAFHLTVVADLTVAQRSLYFAKNAKFETTLFIKWVETLARYQSIDICHTQREAIDATAKGPARFTLYTIEAIGGTVTRIPPRLPEDRHFKRARRDLALCMKEAGVEPGDYDPVEAKTMIDKAVKAYRDQIHQEVGAMTGHRLHKWLMERISELCIDHFIHTQGLLHSLSHEVEYDVYQRMAEKERDFSQQMRNLRYLIEYSISLEADRSIDVEEEAALNLVAKADWVAVLYGASDHIHYGITAASLSVSEEYIPSVEYAAAEDVSETDFARESAGYKLGLDLRPDDTLRIVGVDQFIDKLDAEFLKDAGFKLSAMIACLEVLSNWGNKDGSRLSTVLIGSIEEIEARCCENMSNFDKSSVASALRFLILPAKDIMRPAGAPRDTDDVPMWEHNKRTARLTIRPLIADRGHIMWSPALAQKAAEIWTTAIGSGYLPADFSWKHVDEAVRSIKKHLEKQLEERAVEICKRATPHVEGGINFKFRFPSRNFDDVGDFDVLAFWPKFRVVLAIECKYNQPPFCLKDAKRLRERIFGKGAERAQFSKIEARASFFKKNASRLLELLNWPAVAEDGEIRYLEVYVSKDIYWWMRNPPYPVSSKFIRIDQLAFWLECEKLC